MNSKYKNDFNPIEKDCACYACRNYTAAYIAHLFRGKEMQAATLATVHNLFFIVNLMKSIRVSIIDGSFFKYKKEYLARYSKNLYIS